MLKNRLLRRHDICKMKQLIVLFITFFSLNAVAQIYEIEEIEYVATLRELIGINEKSDEFSPYLWGNTLYFTSSRQYNKHNIGEDNWDKNSYLNVFSGKLTRTKDDGMDVQEIRLLSNKLNTGQHTGPISFTASGDTLFFTRVIRVAKGEQPIYKPQLFAAIKKNGKWKKIKRLPFSVNEHAFGHPSYDAVKNRLYFTSDMPGGKGKDDIYYVEKTTDGWSDPVNVSYINTEADEQFPCAVGGKIFYSSNKPGGKGNLDIYYSSPEKNEFPLRLEGLNTDQDDFGITVLDDLSSGFFSSNRNGNDDIFYFTFDRTITVKNQLSGSFKYQSMEGNPADLTVQLFNDEDEFLYEETTDSIGNFKFNNVELDSNFTFKLKGDSTRDLKLDFYDEKGNPIASFLLDEDGAFTFKKLFYDNSGILHFIPEDMIDFNAGSAKLSGKLVIEDQPTQLLSNYSVRLKNKSEAIIHETKTDNNGNFEFNNLNIFEDYFVDIPDCTDDMLIFIYGSADNIYTQLKCSANDGFIFRKLRPDIGSPLTLIEETKEEDFLLNTAELTGKFRPANGKNNIQCLVRVYDEEEIMLAAVESDSLGNFRFTDFSSDQTYKFKAETHIPIELSLYNRFNKEVAVLQEEDNDFFIFRPKGYQADFSLSLLDKNLRFNADLYNRYDAIVVHFNTNESKVKSEEMAYMQPILKILKAHPELKLSVSAYADATASEEYNFNLSKKRGQWIVDYLVNKGIDRNRFTINAYGETKLLDPENDAVNRRAELRLYK